MPGDYGAQKDIFVINADGSALRNITNTSEVDEWAPAWSPDGASIAYDTEDGIFVMRADGTQRRLIIGLDDGYVGRPAWSPNGTELAFEIMSSIDKVTDIATIRLDGSGYRNLTSSPDREDKSPSWSPDGNYIAFDSRPAGEPAWAIFVYDFRISWALRLTPGTSPALAIEPAFSPDGQRTAMVSGLSGKWEIWTMDTSGVGWREVTFTPDPEISMQPCWSPDGSAIAYARFIDADNDRPALSDIWIVNSDGTNPRNLTQSCGVSEFKPTWR